MGVAEPSQSLSEYVNNEFIRITLFFSSLKTERTAGKLYRTRDEAKADVFDYIECFYNPKRRHSTIGYMSPMEFEMKAGLA
jgi:putative transposase